MKSVLLDLRLPAVGLVGLLLGCSTSRVVKPRAPDMTALVESYEHPSGELDPRATAEIAAAVGVVSQLLDGTEIVPRVRELLGELLVPVDFDGSGVQAGDDGLQLEFEADGYLRATRICPGWTLPARANPENGTLRATATFSERGLDPVVWGTVAACRYRAGDSRIELTPLADEDGLRVYWGDGVAADSLDRRDLLISLKLSAAVDGERAAVDLDLRLVGDAGVEYRLPVDSGSLVVRANEDGSFVVRTRDGDYACDRDFACDREPIDAP